MRFFTLFLFICSYVGFIPQGLSQHLEHDRLAQRIDNAAEQALQTFHTPGMAIGIIKNGHISYLKGFGVADVDSQTPVSPDTYFRLGSTSKAFTALSMAMLLEQNPNLTWHTPVEAVLPNFALSDPYASRAFELIDLLTHNSGLAGGAGDSMLWPEPSGFSRDEVVQNLKYLTPQAPFHSQYGYSNVLYITAGRVVAKEAGTEWGHWVDTHIMHPLSMPCFAGAVPLNIAAEAARPYDYDAPQGFVPIPRNAITSEPLVSSAAGGVVCNARSMLKWIDFWLQSENDSEQVTSGNQLGVSKASINTLLSARTLLPISANDQQWNHTHFKQYALGWRLSDVLGTQVISHTGTLSGFQSYVAFIPDYQTGIVVLNNGSNSGARQAITQTFLHGVIAPDDTQDWVSMALESRTDRIARYVQKHPTPQGTGKLIRPAERYVGVYHTEWFGDAVISNGSPLRIHLTKMPMMKGRLVPFDGDRWKIEWDNRNASAPHFADFTVSPNGNVSHFTLAPFQLDIPLYHYYSDITFVKAEQKE